MKQTLLLILLFVIAAPFVFQYLFGMMNSDHFYLGILLIFVYGIVVGALLLRLVGLMLSRRKGNGASDQILNRMKDEGRSKLGE